MRYKFIYFDFNKETISQSALLMHTLHKACLIFTNHYRHVVSSHKMQFQPIKFSLWLLIDGVFFFLTRLQAVPVLAQKIHCVCIQSILYEEGSY